MSDDSSPRFSPGDEVRLVSSPDRAGSVAAAGRLIQGEYWYPIFFGAGQTERHPEGDLEAYTLTKDVLGLLRDQRFARREAFARRLTYLKLARALRSHVYALQASRTTFYAYQFKPVIKFLDSDRHRLLIADEVGLGKTIEAGLILTELRARVALTRVLIVAPSHLLSKWQDEMRRRFALEFEILDRSRATDFLTSFERDGDECRVLGIMSLQTLRGRKIQERWQAVAPTFDLVVFDEAGRLRNEGTLSNRAATAVAEGADALLLLTATPVQTGERDLFALLNLLDPDDFSQFDAYLDRLAANRRVLDAIRLVSGGPSAFAAAADRLMSLARTPYGRRLHANPIFQDVMQRLQSQEPASRRELIELQRDLNALDLFGHVLSRTRRREVDECRAIRDARTVVCTPSALEVEFYRVVTQLCRRALGQAAVSGIAAFALMMPQRQMASCMSAMVAYLKERLLRGELALPEGEASDLAFDDLDDEEEPYEKTSIDWSELGDLDARARELEQSDSKFASLLRVVEGHLKDEPGAKIVVFSFFKRTLAYLERRLHERGIRTALISGDVRNAPQDPDRDERGRRLRAFRNDPAINVLLSTEVGNEGLDLQFAHVLVNYDLPWNPMVVEQRIGRLDRIGQRSPTIRIYNLTIPGTIEDRILSRLYLRVKIFENSIGDLEDILGQEVRELSLHLMSSALSDEQIAARIELAADAVERQRLAQQELESRVSSLIGNDEFFRDEIARARDDRRYVTGEELIAFVRDFLAEHFAQTAVREAEPGILEVAVSDQLRWFIRRRLGADDARWHLFQRRTSSGRLLLTVDTELAQDRPEVDLLAFHHPFVAAISGHYAESAAELHPVSWLTVRIPRMASGRYIWLLYLTELTGARPSRELEFIAVRHPDGSVLPVDESDLLLRQMISDGKSTRLANPRLEVSGRLTDLVQEAAVERINRRFGEQRALNNALVDSRLASLENAHQRNMTVREERLAVARVRDRAPQYIRMLEGGLRKLQSKFEMRRRELDEQRRMGRSMSIEAAGVVEVTNA